MKIDPSLIIPKYIYLSNYLYRRKEEFNVANDRFADTRFNHFNKRRYQALAVIQMRINEEYKLGKAKEYRLTHPDAIRS